MAGQGSPRRAFARPALLRLRAWLAAALLCLLAVLLASQARAEDLDLRVRLAWGGGMPQSWQGTIRVAGGALSDVIPLGLEPDAPGSMQLIDDSTLAVAPRHPRGYDGVDFRVVAPRDASLVVEFQPVGGEPLPPTQWRLETLAKVFQQSKLDEQGNRLVGQRSPGDRLPVGIPREHLVFAPGEKFEFTAMPRALDLSPSSGYLLNVALLSARGGAEITSQDREFKTDAAATPQLEGIFALTLPNEEGVYDVRIALYPKRLGSALVRGKPVSERHVQLAIVDPALRNDQPQAEWETALELDPANPRWWEKMIRIPTITRIPGFGQQTYGNGRPGIRAHLDRSLVELTPDMWQAYPLAIGDVGRLHLLEVEYPSDLAQSLQISLVEPNAAGQVVPVGLDSGLEVPPPLPGATGKLRLHRIPFWPNTKSPLVLLVNRSAGAPAVYGKIRVLVGPHKLPPAKLPPTTHPQRTLAVSLDRPFFCESFGAAEALDTPTGYTRKDWVTFYQGASRLVEYLEHTGRSAALITLAGEGSALFPSPLLEPTPQYDSGIYFDSGQDPLRKDVAELLFRMFDRAGLQLIPTVKFASPLPELEALAQQPDAALGLLPIGADGQTWMARHAGHRGAGVRYNPLDPRVQQAMRRVVAEIAERYGHHPSFGGVAVQLGPDSYTILPDEVCSLDDATIARFSDETKTVVPGDGLQRYAQRARFLQREGRSAWLDWRAGQLANLYQGMEADVARTHAGARLYLHTGDLLAAPTMEAALQPTLSQPKAASAALLHVGIDPQRLVGQGTIVIPRPQRLVPSFAPDRELIGHFNHWPELDDLTRSRGDAFLFTHEPAPLRLTTFDQAGPYGADKTHTWFVPPLLPAGALARQRLVHGVASSDAQAAIDGGWLLPLGQDEPLRGIVAVFRRLPAEPFQTAEPRGKEGRTQPVVVRTLAHDGKTYFYAANDSPWPVSLEIEFESAEIFRLISYHPDKPGTLVRQASRGTWSVKLDPFDLVGGELTSERVKVGTWRVTLPPETENYLRQQIQEVRQRAAALRQPPQLDVLANPSFELPPAMAGIPGWTNVVGPGAVVEVDGGQARTGAACLHLASRREENRQAPVVWVRSDRFAPPTTGRLSLVAWIKLADPKQQPNLRLAIEGKVDGESFYRRANIGAAEDGGAARPLGTAWAPYRFPLTSLPRQGLTELRVGFDLMGEGEVWIDDVQVYDLWFEEAEHRELLKVIANADFQLSAGQVADCQRFVEGYWAQFLKARVPLVPPQAAADGGEATADSADAPRRSAEGPGRRERRKEKESEQPEEKPGMFDRMRGWWSKPLWR